MAVNFLHGVETIPVFKGARSITIVKTAVVLLVGAAPMGPVNTITRVSSELDAVQFGNVSHSAGFSIPAALDAHWDAGAGVVLVVNVLDPTSHKTAVTAESKTVSTTTNKYKLAHPNVASLVVKSSDNATTYVLGTDYTVDTTTGEVTRLTTGTIPAGATLNNAYDWLDPSKVLNTDIIGTVNGAGKRTGIKAAEDAYNLFGYKPKILIAPGYSSQNTVAVDLISMANKLRAVALIDAPVGTTPSAAIAGRGPSGAINFNTSSDRALLLYPFLKNGETLEPYSQRYAGVMCATDVNFGYWWSPSNKEIPGITGSERPISASVNDPNTEANALNEAGIITVFNSFGTGLRTWGNRSAAYPSSTHPTNFISVRRTADVLHESVELAMLQFIDYPINDALIDAIRESVNAFIRTLIGRGALIDGNCTYDPAKNPPTEIAAGHLTFDLTFMPPTPAERITFESFIDINLLAGLGAQS